jgi:hypothetical protein
MRHVISSRLRNLWRDRVGGIFIYTAVAAPVIFGFAGMSIDIGVWYANMRLTQTAADSAAIAGALEVLRSDSDSLAVFNAVNQDLGDNGFSTGNGDGVTIYYPPLTGPNAGATDSVEVRVVRPTASLFGEVLFAGGANVTARAVAMADINDTCIWSLNPSDSGAVTVSGGANVTLGCGVVVNSNDPDALVQGGSSCLNATEVRVVGGVSGGTCMSSTPLTGVTPIIDPLASVQAPPYGSCDFPQNFNINSGQTVNLTPGVYCGAIRVQDGTVNFAPGLYVLDGAELNLGGQANVTGIDVSFYLSTEVDNNPEAITISAGADVTLKAPPDGPLPGILFYHDRNAPSLTHKLNGGSDMNLEGILYFPSSDLQFSGGTNLDSSTSLIIANTVTFTGNTDIGGFENTPNLSNPLLISATLIE